MSASDGGDGCTAGDECASRDKRAVHLRHAMRLEFLTVGWNVLEGLIAVTAAALSGSIALMGFGIDSFVECASGGVLIWRLTAERTARDEDAIERLDRLAHRLVGVSLVALAAYIWVDAGLALWHHNVAEVSPVGIALTVVSIGVMWWLAGAKRRTAIALGSRALEADSFQTTACWWLSLITLGGLGLNAITGWWWADPAAAIGMTYFLLVEAREAWRGEDSCRGDSCRAHDAGGSA